MIGRFAAIASLALSSALPATEISPPLQPLGAWVLDYGETQCLATRDYGKASDPITLGIRPAPNGETYEIFIVRERSNPLYAEQLQGTVDFGSGPSKAWLLHYGPQGKKLSVYQFRISAADMERARSASDVKFHIERQPEMSFQLSTMASLIEGLKDCTANLMDYWNAGLKGKIVATPSKGDVRAVFTGDDYPTEALRNLQQGTAQYLLFVKEDGHVAHCHVLKPSGVPALDAMGCAVLEERTKFKPALDAAGKPIRSTVVTPPVTWRIGH